MPRQTAADRVLARLVAGGREAAEAGQRLQWGNFDTIDHVLAAIDDGAQVPVSVLADIGITHRIATRVSQRWDLATVFDDDAHFTTQRLVLLVRPRFPILPPGLAWEPFMAQMRRMWRVGRVQDPYIFMNLAWGAVHRKHTQFAIEIIAHTGYSRDMVEHKASLHSDEMMKFVARNWHRVEAVRERLFYRVWLPGQLTPAERKAIKPMPRPLLADLYRQLRVEGYDGYATHVVNAQQSR